MNKKGFSLIELLAVIVILGVVIGIATASITAIRGKMKQQLTYEKLAEGVEASKKFVDHKDIYRGYVEDTLTDGECIIVTFQKIIDEGDYEAEANSSGLKEVKHDVTNASLNDVSFCVYKKYQQYFSCIPMDASTFGDKNKERLTKLEDTDIANLYCSDMSPREYVFE